MVRSCRSVGRGRVGVLQVGRSLAHSQPTWSRPQSNCFRRRRGATGAQARNRGLLCQFFVCCRRARSVSSCSDGDGALEHRGCGGGRGRREGGCVMGYLFRHRPAKQASHGRCTGRPAAEHLKRGARCNRAGLEAGMAVLWWSRKIQKKVIKTRGVGRA
ncbi:uncharacterized protein IWZ02DRAFT_206267 [Phyllosticta citriasiana]|uniref:uncharacterized protein n=1 Tax=Phyllosticta citriasiana TaxID=595635 RepID=UPI0030FD9E08